MKSSKIQETIHITKNAAQNTTHKSVPFAPVSSTTPHDEVSFTGAGSKVGEKGWQWLRGLADNMADVTEITNALIAAIGTGIIAPIVILGSPGKGDKEDKDKKFLQAIRQPLSAVLALSFQGPTTWAITNAINKSAYEGGRFKDEFLGQLIPSTSYLGKQVTKQEIQDLAKEFDAPDSALRKEFEAQIRKDLESAGQTVTDSELAKRVEKGKEKFLKDKIVSQKRELLFEAKVKELQAKGNLPEIKDIDLVTKDYQESAVRYKDFIEEYKAIESKAELTWFDKFARTMGFDTKRVKALKAEQEVFAKKHGLELLKKDLGEKISDEAVRLRKYIENRDVKAQKLFEGKKFWLTLLVNLFMVSASCYALNWVHPRFNDLINKIKNRNADDQSPDNKKVEVKA